MCTYHGDIEGTDQDGEHMICAMAECHACLIEGMTVVISVSYIYTNWNLELV